MAVLTVQSIRKAGIADFPGALVAADVAGDSVDSSSGIFIAMANGDVAPHTLTIAAPSATTQCGGYGELPVADMTLTVAASGLGVISVPANYIDGSGNFAWTYDAVTSVTIGVFSISP